MKTKIVYLPLDERPCNYDFAKKIADGAPDLEFVRPPKFLMGDKKIPADFEGIRKFLLESAAGAEVCILSLDTLLYGGIVPSRLHNLSAAELSRRLSTVSEIKAANPNIKIYAFALIMRCPSYSSADEEPDYYEYCGREIFLTGQVKHKRELKLISDEEADGLLKEYAKKTGEHLADFEARRQKNLGALVEIMEMVGGDIDFLVIPQDDSAPYGYTTRDRESLKKIARERNLKAVAMYPSADEVGMTLLARAVLELKGIKPEIECVYATEKAKKLVPLYEDRELEKTLLCQIEAAGCEAAEGGDIKLFLNYPANAQVEDATLAGEGYADRNIPAFTKKIVSAVRDNKVVAIADGAFCNGGDGEFIKGLSKEIPLFLIAAYAGWNTSSNTLGTAICQAVFVYIYGKNAAQNKFLAERYFEDIGYCGHTRAHMCKNVLPAIGYGYFDAGESRGVVAEKVREEIEDYIGKLLPEVTEKYKIGDLYMPWARMFEVGLSAEEKGGDR